MESHECISCRRPDTVRGSPFAQARPLTEAELRTLSALLGVEFVGADGLLAQLAHVRVTGNCPCGCPSIDLYVPEEIPPSEVIARGSVIPVEGHVLPIDEMETRLVIVYVMEGRLARLAYASSEEPGPTEWPARDRLAVAAMPNTNQIVTCRCPSCGVGGLPVPREFMPPPYVLDDLSEGFEAVCVPNTIGGQPRSSCAQRHRFVNGVGWVLVNTE